MLRGRLVWRPPGEGPTVSHEEEMKNGPGGAPPLSMRAPGRFLMWIPYSVSRQSNCLNHTNCEGSRAKSGFPGDGAFGESTAPGSLKRAAGRRLPWQHPGAGGNWRKPGYITARYADIWSHEARAVVPRVTDRGDRERAPIYAGG